MFCLFCKYIDFLSFTKLHVCPSATIYTILYLKGIKFRRYLISQLEKKIFLRVLNFAIWWLQNISQVFNITILVKIRVSLNEYNMNMNINLIVNQCNCYETCYRNSNFVTISRDMRHTGINIILRSNIGKKRISSSGSI